MTAIYKCIRAINTRGKPKDKSYPNPSPSRAPRQKNLPKAKELMTMDKFTTEMKRTFLPSAEIFKVALT